MQLPPPSLLAIGRGFGHGVGMSQWGAHGMANRGQSYELRHGSVVIAAITSCTNTSNPYVMIAAGLLARNAVERGLTVHRLSDDASLEHVALADPE